MLPMIGRLYFSSLLVFAAGNCAKVGTSFNSFVAGRILAFLISILTKASMLNLRSSAVLQISAISRSDKVTAISEMSSLALSSMRCMAATNVFSVRSLIGRRLIISLIYWDVYPASCASSALFTL